MYRKSSTICVMGLSFLLTAGLDRANFNGFMVLWLISIYYSFNILAPLLCSILFTIARNCNKILFLCALLLCTLNDNEGYLSIYLSVYLSVYCLTRLLSDYSFSQSFWLIFWNSQHYRNCKCNCHSSLMVHRNSIACLQKVVSHQKPFISF